MVIECTAALAMADGVTNADPVHTQVVRVERTDPGIPAAIPRRPAAWVVWKLPFITVEVTASNARGLSDSVGAMKFAAALFTTPVSAPCSSQRRPIAASTPSPPGRPPSSGRGPSPAGTRP